MTTLSIRDLHVSFGSTPAVSGVNLDLGPGERVGLIGESGSGKSVTALSVMRLVKGATTSGQILLDDVDVLAMSTRQMEKCRGKRIAMIYQDPMSSLNPVMKIGQQLAEALSLHTNLHGKALRDRALELLDEVGVTRARERLDAYPHQFSGGMRQRVMIAMALCGNPEVLIADEPTTALDVTTQARIIDLMHHIVESRGASVLLITHDMGVAAGFCDEIHVMRHGEIVERAPAQQLYDHPHHPYSRGLLGAVVDLTTDHTRPIPTIDQASEVNAEAVEPAVRTGTSAEPRRVPTQAAHTGSDDREPVLTVQGISKTFSLGRDRITAVDNVSFTVHRGQTFGLVGESGCGKSTVSRCVLNLITPDSGNVEYAGRSVTGAPRGELRQLRQHLQIVFQDPFSALNPRHTVERIVTAPLAAHRIGTKAQGREKAAELLELVGLDARFLKRLPRALSGGQCQRVAIARSLILDPEFLILDESVSALDVSIQAQVLNLLRDLQSRLGLSYLFVSHDLAVVRFMSSDIAVMQGGRIVEQASRDALFTKPQHDYTKSLLDAVPLANPRLERPRRSGGSPLLAQQPMPEPTAPQHTTTSRVRTRHEIAP